jgi:TRAP-type mannitol/chloroaromatic compound transport system substrate-binding protein
LIIENAAAASNLWMLAEFEAKNLEALQTLKDKYKVKVQEFPADILKKLKALTDETLAEEAAKDADFKRILQAYQKFQANNTAWNEISETAYANSLKL